MTSFKKTNTKYYPKANVIATPDSQYWKNFEFPITVKEYSLIHHIDVSPIEPYYIAVTTGPKIDLYHQQSAQVWRSLSRFQKSAYCGTFRDDGNLLVAGSEEAQVKLFNYRQKQLLRVFKGHKGPVHCTKFVHGKQHISSFSDDKSIKLWDIAEESEVCHLEGHKDYIRAGATSPSSEHIIVSGSYDHEIKMWDMRTGSSVLSFNHGSPISCVLFYPTGCLFASSGGTEVKIWDAIAGKLLSVLSQHHKTITSLCFASNNQRLLSSSIDQHIKVYDLNNYTTVHTMDYPAPVLSMAVAPMDSTIVTGMLSKGPNPMVGGSGLISFQHKKITDVNVPLSKRKARDPLKHLPVDEFTLGVGDEVKVFSVRDNITHLDKMLSRFEYNRVLNSVMQKGIVLNHPHKTMSVLRELIRRNALASTLAGRSAKSLCQFLRFITKHIRNPSYTNIVSEVVNTILDLYGDEFGEDNRLLLSLKRFNEELETELTVTKGSMELLGILDMFTAISSSNNNTDDSLAKSDQIELSDGAKDYEVLVEIR